MPVEKIPANYSVLLVSSINLPPTYRVLRFIIHAFLFCLDRGWYSRDSITLALGRYLSNGLVLLPYRPCGCVIVSPIGMSLGVPRLG